MVFTNLTATPVSRKFFERITEETLKTIHQDGEIGIILMGAARMKKLNREYKGQNLSTDVLAFPYATPAHETEMIFHGSFVEKERPLFGEIVICIPVAKKQARRAGHSLEKELATLAIHGILHVYGYDHERSEKDAKTMFELQDAIFLKLKMKNEKVKTAR